MKTMIITMLSLLLAVVAVVAQSPADAQIRSFLVERIETQKQGVGIVVGIIEPKGRRVIAYGSLKKGDARSLNGDTVFEIGSMTKLFTALLLTEMAQRGEVALSDPVAKYLPPEVKLPERDGQVIRLLGFSYAHVGAATTPHQSACQKHREPVCGVFRARPLSISLRLSVDAEDWRAIQILESRQRTAGAGAGAARERRLRSLASGAHLRTAGTARYTHCAFI